MIHRFWAGPPHPGAEWTARAIATALHAAPTDWTLDTLPEGCPVPDGPPRHLSNFVRAWLLHSYGGLWLDHDVIPLTDLRCSYPYTAAIGLNHREGAVMWFPKPGHPMLAEVLIELTPSATGAETLTEVGRRYPDVRLEPRVTPHAADGTLLTHRTPLAIHLWESSRLPRPQEIHR